MSAQPDTNHNGPSLATFEQNVLRILGRMVRNKRPYPASVRALFDKKETSRDLTAVQGLLHRAGLLRTVLYAARKEAAKRKSDDGSESVFVALGLVATVLHDLWSAGNRSVYGEVFKSWGDGGYQFAPLALGALDVVTYERLTLEALQVANIAADFVAARLGLDNEKS